MFFSSLRAGTTTETLGASAGASRGASGGLRRSSVATQTTRFTQTRPIKTSAAWSNSSGEGIATVGDQGLAVDPAGVRPQKKRHDLREVFRRAESSAGGAGEKFFFHASDLGKFFERIGVDEAARDRVHADLVR